MRKRLSYICTILFLLVSTPTAEAPAASFAAPAPTPRCWNYDKIYPVTEAAFKSQHVTVAETKEIEKWAAPASLRKAVWCTHILLGQANLQPRNDISFAGCGMRAKPGCVKPGAMRD